MRLHLIDGTFELFRAHFSPRPSRSDPSGNDIKATHGFAASLVALLADAHEQVSHAAVAFDHPIESFRNKMFAGYKNSSTVDPALLAQFDIAQETALSLGLTVWSMDEYEADDALASAATTHRRDFQQIRILTPDKDLGQVVAGCDIVQVDRIRGKEIDETGVRLRLGVAPAVVPDLLALVGDPADGIPGIPGFGAKTASRLLEHFGRLDAISHEGADWPAQIRGAQRLASVLHERREEAVLYRRLATLITDLDLDSSRATLVYRGADRQHWEATCERFGFGSLAQQPGRWQ